jgi:hypothetical protein
MEKFNAAKSGQKILDAITLFKPPVFIPSASSLLFEERQKGKFHIWGHQKKATDLTWGEIHLVMPMQTVAAEAWFEQLVVLVIVLNVVVLSADHYGQSEDFAAVLAGFNGFFTFFFVGELAALLLANGPTHFRSLPNKFDVVVVLVSLVDLCIPGNGSSVTNVIRALRLLRLGKLLKTWKDLRVVLEAVMKSFNDMGWFMLLVVIYIYNFTILGNLAFGNGRLPQEGLSKANFDNFGWSAMTVFQVMTGENWNDVMVTATLNTSGWASFYFIILFMTGNYIMVNIFLAILLSHYQPGDADEEDDEQESDHETAKSGDQINAKDKEIEQIMQGEDEEESGQSCAPQPDVIALLKSTPDEVSGFQQTERSGWCGSRILEKPDCVEITLKPTKKALAVQNHDSPFQILTGKAVQEEITELMRNKGMHYIDEPEKKKLVVELERSCFVLESHEVRAALIAVSYNPFLNYMIYIVIFINIFCAVVQDYYFDPKSEFGKQV